MQDDAKLIERLQASVAELTGRGSVLPPRIQEAVNAMEYAADRLSTLSRDREDIRREAFEEAAKVADDICETHALANFASGRDSVAKAFEKTGAQIAARIRVLNEPPANEEKSNGNISV